MSLKIINLAKRYDDNWVLKNITFEAQKGEVTGIFGATSAGKSTLIRAIAGNLPINGGEIIYDSAEVTKLPCAERGFQFPSVKNDSFWKTIFKTQKSSELSEGDGQMLALKNALENADGVLLLDDSFCLMDMHKREESFALLRRFTREKNLTVLFATNDFEEVFAVCDQVAVLARGEIQQFGAPREVYEHPANFAVASVAGRINLITARRLTSSKTDIPQFQTIEGEHRLFTDKAEKSALGAINQNVALSIRPEHISISFGASFPEDNLLKAAVTGIKFQGATTLIELDANGLPLEAIVLRLVGLNVGDECMVGLPPDRIKVLKG